MASNRSRAASKTFISRRSRKRAAPPEPKETRMLLRIARFELRYQLKNPVFWVAAAMFFLLTFGAVASEAVQTGAGGNIYRNASTSLTQLQIIFSLFFMFVTTAFVANVVV